MPHCVAGRHPGLVAHEPSTAALRDRRGAGPACPALHPGARRKLLDRATLFARSSLASSWRGTRREPAPEARESSSGREDRGMWRIIVVGSLILAATLCLPFNTHATPSIVNDLAFIDNRPADDIFGVQGVRLSLDINVTDAGGSGALTGPGAGTRATSSNASFPFTQPVTVPFNSFFGLLGGEFTANLLLSGGAADFSKVTGTYG